MEIDIRIISARCFGKALVVACLALAVIGCKSDQSRVTVQNEEPPPGSQLVSAVRMNDPAAASQLMRGFYGVENNAWRWTAGKFSVLLRTPPGAQSGAVVSLSLSIPDGVIQKQKDIAISASVAGSQLKSQTYNAAGPFTFTADIPPAQLNAPSVTVDFAVNKTFRPDGDARDLAIIANSVSIAAK